MSDSLTAPFSARPDRDGALPQSERADAAPWPLLVQYGVCIVMVALATELGFVARDTVNAGNLSLIYVLPVVIAATAFGWGPSLLSVVLSVLAYDFFFTQPYYSLVIARPADIWAAALLFVVAALVSAVATRSRRRALEARRAAEQALALQGLAHLVVQGRGEAEVLRAAAAALQGIFGAPAAIFVDRDGEAVPMATAGNPPLGHAEREAATGVLAAQTHVRAEAYPYEQSRLELWPVASRLGRRFVVGVDFSGADRPVSPATFVDLVGAYLGAAGR